MTLGVDVYYFSPLWPYKVGVDITVDSETPDFVDLLDPSYAGREISPGNPETIPSRVMWQKTGLSNTIHTVVVSMPPGGQFVVVDGFKCVPDVNSYLWVMELILMTPSFTVLDAMVLNARSASTSSPSKTIIIAVSAGAGGGALVIICLVTLWFYRRHRRRQSSDAPFNPSHDLLNVGTAVSETSPVAVPPLHRSQPSQISYVTTASMASSADGSPKQAVPSVPRARLQRPERARLHVTSSNSSLATGADSVPPAVPRKLVKRHERSRNSYATTSNLSSSTSSTNWPSPPLAPFPPRPGPTQSPSGQLSPSNISIASAGIHLSSPPSQYDLLSQGPPVRMQPPSTVDNELNRSHAPSVNENPAQASHLYPRASEAQHHPSTADQGNLTLRESEPSAPPSGPLILGPPSTFGNGRPSGPYTSAVAEKQALAFRYYSEIQQQPSVAYQGTSSLQGPGHASGSSDPPSAIRRPLRAERPPTSNVGPSQSHPSGVTEARAPRYYPSSPNLQNHPPPPPAQYSADQGNSALHESSQTSGSADPYPRSTAGGRATNHDPDFDPSQLYLQEPGWQHTQSPPAYYSMRRPRRK